MMMILGEKNLFFNMFQNKEKVVKNLKVSVYIHKSFAKFGKNLQVKSVYLFSREKVETSILENTIAPCPCL